MAENVRSYWEEVQINFEDGTSYTTTLDPRTVQRLTDGDNALLEEIKANLVKSGAKQLNESCDSSVEVNREVDLLQKAKTLQMEIREFVKYHKPKLLPKANDVHLIPSLCFGENEIGEEEREKVAFYLCSQFPELRDISNKDVTSLLHDTIDFVLKYKIHSGTNGEPEQPSEKATGSCPASAMEIDSSHSHPSILPVVGTAHANNCIWTRPATLSLLNLWKEHQNEFASPKSKKKSIWEKITKNINKNGFEFSWTQVESKWKNITKKYRDTIDHNSKSGNDKKTCTFYDELSDIYGYRPNCNPDITISNLDIENVESEKRDNTNVELEEEVLPTPKRKKFLARKRATQSSEVVETVKAIHDDQKKMHSEKMALFSEYLNILRTGMSGSNAGESSTSNSGDGSVAN